MIKATMGNTNYVLDTHTTPGMCTIRRINQDGETPFYVPIALFDSYARELMNGVAGRFIEDLLRR